VAGLFRLAAVPGSAGSKPGGEIGSWWVGGQVVEDVGDLEVTVLNLMNQTPKAKRHYKKGNDRGR
jgi:hypothetical protein